MFNWELPGGRHSEHVGLLLMCCRGKGECQLPGEPLKRRLVRRPPIVYAVKKNHQKKHSSEVCAPWGQIA